jgi:hypothetical protein
MTGELARESRDSVRLLTAKLGTNVQPAMKIRRKTFTSEANLINFAHFSKKSDDDELK